MKHVSQDHPCPQCEQDCSFVTLVALRDYCEIKTFKCPHCGHYLTAQEKEAIEVVAWEHAHDPAREADEYGDYLYDRDR